jgi:DNA-binding HxlR family transcriptional regulator
VRASSPTLAADLHAENCPSREILDHVTSRWGVLVLLALRERTHRFSELRQRIGGVSEKMLAQTLKTLEGDGFVNRRAYAEVPPRVEYELTTMGREVSEHVAALGDWILQNLSRVQAERRKRSRASARR